MTPDTCSFQVSIDASDAQRFADISGDYNPLHLDEAYARTTEFGKPLIHGAYLLGLASRVLGMHIPGKRSLILSINSRFPKPLFYPATVNVEGRLQAFDAERETGLVAVTVTNSTSRDVVLEAQVKFALHGSGERSAFAPTASPPPSPAANPDKKDKPALLVTGATGGLGSAILPSLAGNFSLVCLTRQVWAKAHPDISYVSVDLEDESALSQFLLETSPQDFYGILHMSSPAVAKGLVT